MTVKEGELLWQPSQSLKDESNIVDYMNWLKEHKQLSFSSYDDMWQWSVTDLEAFWGSLWDYFSIKASKSYKNVIVERSMPGAHWFDGAALNYAENVFSKMSDAGPAIMSKSELRPLREVTWESLHQQVAAFAAALKAEDIQKGDRIAAYIPNIEEAIVAFLACASIGAVWSSCSPDFGSPTVIDRFKQIEPKILIAVDGYRYNGKDFNRMSAVRSIQDAIPTIKKTVLLPYLSENPEVEGRQDICIWESFVKPFESATLQFEQVAFDHPLWILYSSGTTGLPKAIVQGQGGILLEHLKMGAFHMNLKPEDHFFWFTTTGWMMWNVVVSGLLTGSTIILYDGNPGFPDMNTMWQFAEETGMTFFGTSASYLLSCMNAGITPRQTFNLEKLKGMGSTGSPLPPEGFQWVYEQVKKDLWLVSTSGGTDLCSAFVGGSPLLPVHIGEIQCRALGAKVEAYNEAGESVINEVGELVLTEPMPSMPLFLWNDEQGKRYHDSYFDMYQGIWRHGDWIKITETGSCIIYGRSDSTINRGGVRMGTSEIYRQVESVDDVEDSLIIDIKDRDGHDFMPLYVVLKAGVTLDKTIKTKINRRIKDNCSPRHVPNEIYQIEQVPRTLNGKKLEVPIKKILMGVPVEKAANKGSLANPDSLDYFIHFKI